MPNPADAFFDEIAREQVPRGAELSSRPMMSSTRRLTIGGKIFAMLVDGRLVVKLPKATVADLVGSGQADPFQTKPGQPMKEWATVEVGAGGEQWSVLAEAARSFVGAASPQ